MAELARVIRGLVFVLGTVAVVTACGGGGSSAPADVEPEPFTLSLESGSPSELEPGNVAVFSTVTVGGINRTISVSVTGGEYSIDGGDFTSAEGSISSGQTLQLRAPASTGFGEVVTVTLNLGDDFERTLQLTTRPKDETPEDFSFTASTSQELGASVNSNAVTITGIDPAVALSVENGSYSLDNGTTFETADTTIDADQTIILQGTASSSYETTETVSLTVGTESANFSITTRAKDTTPTAFEFTPATEQEINTSIDSNTVTITGVDPETDISIENGTYSLDGGETFTDAAATINVDQEVIVRLTTSGDYESDVTATLTVGTESQNFVATTRARDITPENLGEFVNVVDGNPSTEYTSNVITVADVEGVVDISISEGATYAINNGDYVSTSGSVTNTDTLSVRLSTSSQFNDTNTATLTVGTETRTFSVTAVEDNTPAALSFTGVSEALEPSTVYTSNEIAISDINVPVTVSVSGSDAQYRINTGGVWGDYTSAQGQVVSGDLIQVQATAASTPSTTVDLSLTVGSLNEVYSLQTVADTTPPTAEILFPTPTTLTDGDYVYIRGTATDDYSDIAEIRITVMRGDIQVMDPITLTAGEGESLTDWSTRIEGIAQDDTNTISVVAVDSSEAANVQETPAVINVTQTNTTMNFPVSNNAYFGELYAEEMVLHKDESVEELILTAAGSSVVMKVDVNTGIRSELIARTPEFGAELSGVALDSEEGVIYFADRDGGVLYWGDISNGDYNVLVDFNLAFPESAEFLNPKSVNLNSRDGNIYVTDYKTDTSVYRVAPLGSIESEPGSIEIISGVNVPEGEVSNFSFSFAMGLDEYNNSAIVSGEGEDRIIEVNLDTGIQQVLRRNTEAFSYHQDVVILSEGEILLLELERGVERYSKESNTFSFVSSNPLEGNIPVDGANAFAFAISGSVDETREVLYVLSAPTSTGSPSLITVVDLESGERMVVTFSYVET